MKELSIVQEKNFIVKSNALVEAKYRLSLQETHVIYWLLTQIQVNDEDFKPHKMQIEEFSKMVGVEVDNQYSKLRSVTKNLMRRVLEIYDFGKEEWLQVAWLNSARYQKKRGCIMLRFSPDLKPYLLQLKGHFTKISIVDTLRLKSIYAVRIFELLIQYAHVGKRVMSIEQLRNYCAIEKNEYKKYSHLKKKVIERAKTEINCKTEYEIDYVEIKESRRVVSVEWSIKKRTHFEKFQEEKLKIIQKEMRSENALIEEILEYGFSRVTAKRFIKENSEEIVRNAIKSVNLQVERGNVKNPKAMLRVAIQKLWNPEIYLSRNTLPKDC